VFGGSMVLVIEILLRWGNALNDVRVVQEAAMIWLRR
jgi:hypothetical protein